MAPEDKKSSRRLVGHISRTAEERDQRTIRNAVADRQPGDLCDTIRGRLHEGWSTKSEPRSSARGTERPADRVR